MSDTNSPSPRRGGGHASPNSNPSPTAVDLASPPLGGTSAGAAPGVGAANAPGGGNFNKAKALEEFINAFPVDHPEGATSLKDKIEAEHGGKRGATTKESDMKRYEREQTQKRAGREAVKSKLGNNIKRQRIETWVQLSEKNNTKLKRENEALEKIATLTQENCIDNDHRFEEAISALRSELEFTTIYRQDNSETLDYIRDAVGSIQDRINQMRVASEHQAKLEFDNIKEGFERQLAHEMEQLEKVRESGTSTTGEWKKKNEVAQSELEDILLRTDAAYHTFKDLTSTNNRLRVEHNAQENDSTLLENQFRTVSQHHQRLKDRLHDLEVELSSEPLPNEDTVGEEDLLAAIDDVQRGFASGTTMSPLSSDAKQNEYKRSLAKAQQLLEQEAQNLKAVRHAHVMALRQRTELEVFLRQAVINHRRNKQIEAEQSPMHDSSGMAFITNRPPFNVAGTSSVRGGKMGAARPAAKLHATSFTTEDRREVVDALLANQRVLELLYTDPKDAGQALRTVEANAFGRQQTTSIEEDVELLWRKWKTWTKNANDAFSETVGAPKEESESDVAMY